MNGEKKTIYILAASSRFYDHLPVLVKDCTKENSKKPKR